jgi:hypothetical protein
VSLEPYKRLKAVNRGVNVVWSSYVGGGT